MKKLTLNGKLTLDKITISKLNSAEAASLIGGATKGCAGTSPEVCAVATYSGCNTTLC